MAKLSPEQKAVVTAFEELDLHIGECTMPVKQASKLAMLFGNLARAVDEALQLSVGIDPNTPHSEKPKLEAVPDEEPETVQ